MASHHLLFWRFFSPRLMSKALASLDRSAAVVVGVCWSAALIMVIIAVLATRSAVSAKRDAEAALAIEPTLPMASQSSLRQIDVKAVVDRVQHQFPDVTIEADNSQAIIIKTGEGSRFHQWILALNYLDAIDSQYRWTLRDFCVGRCGGDLMRAVVVGQKTSFSVPQSKN